MPVRRRPLVDCVIRSNFAMIGVPLCHLPTSFALLTSLKMTQKDRSAADDKADCGVVHAHD
jgi:hypothetical protein